MFHRDDTFDTIQYQYIKHKRQLYYGPDEKYIKSLINGYYYHESLENHSFQLVNLPSILIMQYNYWLLISHLALKVICLDRINHLNSNLISTNLFRLSVIDHTPKGVYQCLSLSYIKEVKTLTLDS